MSYLLKLYVLKKNHGDINVIDNLKLILEKEVKEEYKLEVIDLNQNPRLAKDKQIMATPLLEKSFPLPVRRIIGDLSDKQKVLHALDLVSYDTMEKSDELRKSIYP